MDKYFLGDDCKQIDVFEGEESDLIIFSYRNIEKALIYLYSYKNNALGFKNQFEKEENDEKERIYTIPTSCEWWELMEKEIRKEFLDGMIAGLMFYSNQTIMTQDMKEKAWPISMSLENI
jgi:hypothetical protein